MTEQTKTDIDFAVELNRDTERLEKRRSEVDSRYDKIEQREQNLNRRQSQIDKRHNEAEKLFEDQMKKLEEIEARDHRRINGSLHGRGHHRRRQRIARAVPLFSVSLGVECSAYHLWQFAGVDVLPRLVITDGVEYLANTANSYWLVSAIYSHLVTSLYIQSS